MFDSKMSTILACNILAINQVKLQLDVPTMIRSLMNNTGGIKSTVRTDNRK